MQSFLTFALCSLCASTANAQFQPNVPIDNRTLSEQYLAAKQESSQPLRVFFGGDAGSQGDGVRTAWKAQFPDIPLNLTVDLSKYHDSRIDRAFYRNTTVVDVAVLQVLSDFPRWKEQNRLLYYKPASFDDLLEEEKDLDGASLPVVINSFGSFIYDNTKLPASEVPSSFASLTDPRWKDKLILTYPNDDDAVAYLFSIIISKYGASWFTALAANNVQWVRGTGTPVFELQRMHNDTSSQRSLTFTQFGTFPNNGTYIAATQPNDHFMSWAQTGAILASTPRPETAKLFMAWITSPDFQRASADVPAVPPGMRFNPGGSSVLHSLNEALGRDPYGSNVTQLSGFRLFEADRARVERWKNFFEDVLGPAKGLDPVLVYPNPPCCA